MSDVIPRPVRTSVRIGGWLNGRGIACTTLILAATASCRSAPPPPPPPSASAELAQLHRDGELDPTRLACAMTAVPVVSEPMGSVLLALSRPGPQRVGGTNSFAATAQQRMAAQDALNATVGAAGLMRQRAMDAELNGRPDEAARYSRQVLALNSAIHREQPRPNASASRTTSAPEDEKSSLEGLSDEELLLEYEWLQADLATIEPGSDPPGAADTRRRIAHIAHGAPRVAETYAELLLFVYNDPAFSCGMTAPTG